MGTFLNSLYRSAAQKHSGTVYIGNGGYIARTNFVSGTISVAAGGTAERISVQSAASLNVYNSGTVKNLYWQPDIGRVAVASQGYVTYSTDRTGVFYISNRNVLSSAQSITSLSMTLASASLVVCNSGKVTSAIAGGDESFLVLYGGVIQNIRKDQTPYIYEISCSVESGATISTVSNMKIDRAQIRGTISYLYNYGGGSQIIVQSGGSIGYIYNLGFSYGGGLTNFLTPYIHVSSGGSINSVKQHHVDVYSGGSINKTEACGIWIRSGGKADLIHMGRVTMYTGASVRQIDMTPLYNGYILINGDGQQPQFSMTATGWHYLVWSNFMQGPGRRDYIDSTSIISGGVHSSGRLSSISMGSNRYIDMWILSGGSFINTTLQPSGTDPGENKLYISKGYCSNVSLADMTIKILANTEVSNLTINNCSIYWGNINTCQVNSGRVPVIGTNLYSLTINEFANVELLNSASATDVTINHGGHLDIYEGCKASYITVYSGGYLVVKKGGAALYVENSGGYISVQAGGVISYVSYITN